MAMKVNGIPAIVASLVVFIAAFTGAAGDESRAMLIETVAGNGQPGDLPSGGGQALNVPVDQPFGVEIGPDGALYITSIGQHRYCVSIEAREN